VICNRVIRTNPGYRKYLQDTQASAVILKQEDAAACPTAVIVSSNPYASYARAAALIVPAARARQGVHPAAVVDPDSSVDAAAWIGPNANVVVCHEVTIGERVNIAPGAVIGSDGFGLANEDGRWLNVPQLGSVRVGNDVEIGSNTTIDRGALDDTVLEEGVRLDNQIQVAHNVHIGAHTAIAGCVGISGSAKIGKYCMIGGGAGIVGHLEIADRVVITGMTMVTKSITRPGVYSSGVPAQENDAWNKTYARMRQLDKLARRIGRLERSLAADRTSGKE